jgi:hypothetical protein
MSTPTPNYYQREGRIYVKKRGRPYTPALDQVPMTGRERYLRQLQNLLLLCPDSVPIRERYYALLVGKIPSDRTRPIEHVINDRVEAIKQGPLFAVPRPNLRRRVTLFLRRLATYIEVR